MALTSDRTSLFNRLLEGDLSIADTEALIEWLGSEELDQGTKELILQQLQKSPVHEADAATLAALEAKLPAILEDAGKRRVQKIHTITIRRIRYAAAVLILTGLASFWFLLNRPTKTVSGIQPVAATIDVAPGMEGAILTTDDGSKLVLDSLGNGVITTKDGAKVILNNGVLTYEDNTIPHDDIIYNTMSTPKGRQFRLQLQDGTQVWLNAASSIRYPVIFTGNERKVEITGEVYFEVAKNKNMPFRVKVNEETEIEVLGTHFNVNSYSNEASLNTTLLEGSVKITSRNENVVLRPGQQAQVGSQQAGRIKVVNDADIEKVMAWKNGVFNFENATLKEVMGQLERWYDIEVVYEKGIPQLEFIGKMGRDLSLANVLRGLEMSKVHFRIEQGRRLVVIP